MTSEESPRQAGQRPLIVATLARAWETLTQRGAVQRGKGGVALALSVSVLAVLWLAVLPWLAERPRLKSRIDWLEQRGIDPSAMYYTELEAMEPILERQQSARRRSAHKKQSFHP